MRPEMSDEELWAETQESTPFVTWEIEVVVVVVVNL